MKINRKHALVCRTITLDSRPRVRRAAVGELVAIFIRMKFLFYFPVIRMRNNIQIVNDSIIAYCKIHILLLIIIKIFILKNPI